MVSPDSSAPGRGPTCISSVADGILAWLNWGNDWIFAGAFGYRVSGSVYLTVQRDGKQDMLKSNWFS